MGVTESRLPVLLLTGASTGLGLAMARHLRHRPMRLVLTARRESMGRFAKEGFEESGTVHLRELEVTDAGQRRRLVEEANGSWGGIDVLINNAGIAYRAVVEHWDDRAWTEIMEIDVHAPIDLIRLVLPGMRERRAGRIINISSVGGMMAMPTMSLYSAAKFALEGATESLWYEVRPWNIHVTLIEPGFIRSDSFRNTRFTQRSFRGVVDHEDPYHGQYLHMASFIERMMDHTISTPESVALHVGRCLDHPHPPLRVYGTLDAHIFALLRRLLPRNLYHWVLYQALPHVRAHSP